MNWRNEEILNLAKEVPECFGCNKINTGNVVAAHSNNLAYGKGMGIKAHDWAIAYVCDECHYFIDDGKASREDRDILWLYAHIKTLTWIFDNNYLSVNRK